MRGRPTAAAGGEAAVIIQSGGQASLAVRVGLRLSDPAAIKAVQIDETLDAAQSHRLADLYITDSSEGCEWLTARNFAPILGVCASDELLAAGADDVIRADASPSEWAARIAGVRARSIHSVREYMLCLARVAEYRDDATGGHAQRVGAMAGETGRVLGLDEWFCSALEIAARVHDIGKVGVSDSILLKEGPLSDEEYGAVREHADLGARLLHSETERLLVLANEIALTHHERWDGTGYPSGLAGTDIPISGRIVAVTDVYDALVRERPYKAAWSPEEAQAEISRLSGEHFDPAVAAAFLDVASSESQLGIESS